MKEISIEDFFEKYKYMLSHDHLHNSEVEYEEFISILLRNNLRWLISTVRKIKDIIKEDIIVIDEIKYFIKISIDGFYQRIEFDII